jgi:hypothetical protein
MSNKQTDSDICAAVLGEGDIFVICPLPLDRESASLKIAQEWGYEFVGIFGLIDGQVKVQIEPIPGAAYTMAHAASGFATYVRTRLTRTKASADSFASVTDTSVN